MRRGCTWCTRLSLRLHSNSRVCVLGRLTLYRIEGEENASPVKSEKPALSAGVRGDAILALLADGNYQLQIEFANPGGISGIPLTGQGSRGACVEMDLELAVEPVLALAQKAGEQCAPELAGQRLRTASCVSLNK